MNDSALKWLTSRAATPGTLACALRHPDGHCLCHTVDAACPEAVMERILVQFESLASVPSAEPAAPRWSTWSFENGQLRLVTRPDGWCLAVVVRNESEAATALDAASQEFLAASFD
jgi:hypothetical protein